MPERRYSRYKQADVWLHLATHASKLGIELEYATRFGHCISLIRHSSSDSHEDHSKCSRERAVILARSSDWYHYSLNSFLWAHETSVLICGTHDSCLPVSVFAIDAEHWYSAGKMRPDWGALQPERDKAGNVLPDAFEKHRRTQYGHNMLIGALMCKREDAYARLATFKPSTRLRIEAKLRKLQKRRVGHPLVVWEAPKEEASHEEHTA